MRDDPDDTRGLLYELIHNEKVVQQLWEDIGLDCPPAPPRKSRRKRDVLTGSPQSSPSPSYSLRLRLDDVTMNSNPESSTGSRPPTPTLPSI